MKRAVARVPVLGRAAGVLFRLRLPVRYVWRSFASATSWLFASRETTNFTYELTDRNIAHLVEFVAVATGRSSDEISGYVREQGIG